MDRHSVKFNSINLDDFNVKEASRPEIIYPRTNFKRISIAGRRLPKYQAEYTVETGSINLELYGVFTSEAQVSNFETQVIAQLNNQASHTIEFGWLPDVEFIVGLNTRIESEEITDWEASERSEQVIKYTITLFIELMRKK